MYCRHLLFNTMVPSAAQRLMGLATTSVSPLSVSLGQTQQMSYSSSSKPPGPSLSDSDVKCSASSCVPYTGLQTLPVLSCTHLAPRHTSISSLNLKVLLRENQLHSRQLSHFHHMSSDRLVGAPGQAKPLHHPLLGTQCSLSADHARRQFSLSPKAILEASPPSLQPYLRLIRFDKPIGTLLLLWPCTWSIALAASPGHLPDLWMLILFGAGAFFMRGAGCIINDMWDSDFDKKVDRTKQRPLACGELSHFQALVFLASQLSISLAILLQLNTYSILLGASSMLLVILYPLAKRYTYWPQIMLGVTLNWGVLLAWSGLRGSLDWSVAPLYLACVLYTMFYDTIYSHQDKYDDMLIGVKSTALKLGDKTKPRLAGFSTVMISCLAATGMMCDQTWPYYTGIAAVAVHLAHQLYTVDLNNADDCAAKFRSNSNLGFFLFLSIVAGTLLRTEKAVSPPSETEDKE